MIFSICLELIYPNIRVEERVDKVASHGFDHVEFWGWKNKNIDSLKTRLIDTGVKLSSFSGHRRGSPTISEDRRLFINELEESIEVAHRLNCKCLMVLSDELLSDGSAKPNEIPVLQKYLNLFESLKEATKIAEKEGITLMLEALNTFTHPRYFLDNSTSAADLVVAIGSPNLKLLYDCFHMQIAEGNITRTLERYIDKIGYVHVADVPDRHEPGTGELNCEYILSKLDSFGYKGVVGFEFEPLQDSDQALKQIRQLISTF